VPAAQDARRAADVTTALKVAQDCRRPAAIRSTCRSPAAARFVDRRWLSLQALVDCSITAAYVPVGLLYKSSRL
jgi:hypothetical protein